MFCFLAESGARSAADHGQKSTDIALVKLNVGAPATLSRKKHWKFIVMPGRIAPGPADWFGSVKSTARATLPRMPACTAG